MKFDGHKKWDGGMVMYTFLDEENTQQWACQQPADGLEYEGTGENPMEAYADWHMKTIKEEIRRSRLYQT